MSQALLDALRHLQHRSWKTSEDHKWHEPREIEGVVRNASTGERLALITSEASEALEEVRKERWGAE